MSEVAERIALIRERIAAAAAVSGRGAEDITLMAVTKTVSPERIREAMDCGISVLGENRVQEFLEKKDALPDARWHIIGHLQSNKVKYLSEGVELIQSVDSLHLAEEIDRRTAGVQDILLQVNVAHEERKFGISPEELPRLLEGCAKLPKIRVRGLMTILPLEIDDDRRHHLYEKCNKIFVDNKGKKYDNSIMDILSMGMSNDFAIAIEEGATLVRVGSAMFGKRD